MRPAPSTAIGTERRDPSVSNENDSRRPATFRPCGVLWSQSLAVFKDSKKPELALEFVKYVMSPEGQARLATSSCFWGMPANSKAGTVLSDEQKGWLRWDEQAEFQAKSHRYFIPDAELDAKMLDVWTEFLQH